MRRVSLLLGLLLVSTGPASARQTAAGDEVPHAEPSQTPEGALWRAAAVPGWGQLYNDQPIKIPVLYLGIGVFAASAIQSHQDYALYRNAYQYKAFQELVESGSIPANPKSGFEDDYQELADQFGSIRSGAIQGRRDALRRNRDLSILGVAAVWGLGVLDAYVSAHLLDFDIGEDLAIRIQPEFSASPDGPAGLTLTARW